MLRRTEESATLHIGSFQPETGTGRFVSKDPNAQALPKKQTKPVRRVISAPDGHSIVAMDFANIEPRCLAQALLSFLANPEKRIDQIRSENRDRAAMQFPAQLDEREWLRNYVEHEEPDYPASSVLAQCFLDGQGRDPYMFAAALMFPELDFDGMSDQERKRRRGTVKTLFLAMIYGRGRLSIATELRITIDEAQNLLDRLDKAIPELSLFRDMAHRWIRHTGFAEGLLGRRRQFAGLYQLRSATTATVRSFLKRNLWEFDINPIQLWEWTLHSYVHEVRDFKSQAVIADASGDNDHPIFEEPGLNRWPFRNISYKTIRSVTIDDELIKFTPIEDVQRQGFNAIFQMTAGDVFKRAILNVQPVCEQFDARMILNVHDELVFVVPNARLHEFVPAAKAAMEERPAPWWEIPIVADVQVGPNYGQLRDYTPCRVEANSSTARKPWWRRLTTWLVSLWVRFFRTPQTT